MYFDALNIDGANDRGSEAVLPLAFCSTLIGYLEISNVQIFELLKLVGSSIPIFCDITSDESVTINF